MDKSFVSAFNVICIVCCVGMTHGIGYRPKTISIPSAILTLYRLEFYTIYTCVRYELESVLLN